MDQTNRALRVFKIQYNLDLKNHKMHFEINIQCMLEAIITKTLLLSMFNNNGFELDQIYTHHSAVFCSINTTIEFKKEPTGSKNIREFCVMMFYYV